MEQSIVSPTMMPRGAGGKSGHALRMIPCIFTAGFAYPNTFVEGMDLTAIQKITVGAPYGKKTDTASKSRF
jgi:hypothetical protein